MGTTSKKIIEKLDSLFTKLDESHQEVIEEISRCNTSLEIVQDIINQLTKLEEKNRLYQNLSWNEGRKTRKVSRNSNKRKRETISLTKKYRKICKI